MNHQILSPYTAFVGVETTGPKNNNTQSKVRHIPIQITKDDEHMYHQRGFFSSYRSGPGLGPIPRSTQMPIMSHGR